MATRRKAGWYAGLRRGTRNAFLLGPYKSKLAAEAVLRTAHDKAVEIDAWCHFDTPCVFRLLSHNLPNGRLNGAAAN